MQRTQSRMTSKWRIFLSVLVIILIAVATGFYLIFSQKAPDNKYELVSAPSIEEKLPQKEEAFKHEREESGDVPPLWENRKLLR